MKNVLFSIYAKTRYRYFTNLAELPKICIVESTNHGTLLKKPTGRLVRVGNAIEKLGLDISQRVYIDAIFWTYREVCSR